MDKVDALKETLNEVGFPTQMQADVCVYSILALAGIKKNTPWKHASNEWLRVHDIIQFANKNYYAGYAENSRETFRKQALHNFRNAAMVEDNGVATNSPNYRWRITNEFLQVLRSIDQDNSALLSFKEQHISLIDLYTSKRAMKKMPVKINGVDFTFSPGKHKIYFVEAVTSVGPMDGKRIVELKEMTNKVSAGIIFVTAFLDFKTYKAFADKLAWETEVWLAEIPEHMLHLNGDRFLGPR